MAVRVIEAGRVKTREELERTIERQARRIRGLRKALRNLEKKHGYAVLRENQRGV